MHYLKTLFIDRLIGNTDRFPFNYGIIKDKENNIYKLCPLFDNGELIGYMEETYFPSLSNNSNDINKVINYLLSHDEILNWVINKVSKTNLDTLCEKLYKDINFTVSSDTYNNFKQLFTDSQKAANEELKKYGSKEMIKLV